jgi:hypothetical protein
LLDLEKQKPSLIEALSRALNNPPILQENPTFPLTKSSLDPLMIKKVGSQKTESPPRTLNKSPIQKQPTTPKNSCKSISPRKTL